MPLHVSGFPSLRISTVPPCRQPCRQPRLQTTVFWINETLSPLMSIMPAQECYHPGRKESCRDRHNIFSRYYLMVFSPPLAVLRTPT
jgi:hypothetical protein